MKTRYILLSAAILLATASSSLLTACEGNDNEILLPGRQQPDNTDGGNTNTGGLQIAATKQPFTDESGTRADTDFGGTYATTFGDGDEIGITAVKNGAVLADCNNVKLTYNAATGQWGGNDIPYTDGATYIAYSPHRAAMNGKTTVQEIYDAFTVSADQSTAPLFAANDLMTSTTCIPNKAAKTLTIAFEHRLALLEIAPELKGVHSDGWKYPLKNINLTAGTVKVDGASIKLFKNTAEGNNAPYRCLLKPGTNKTLALTYEIKGSSGTTVKTVTWNATNQTFTAGQRRRIAPTKKRDIKVGDYYYSDGSFFPSDINTDIPGADKGCIGVVMKVGRSTDGAGDTSTSNNWKDTDTYTSKGGNPMTTIHGYVLALYDGAIICEWSTEERRVSTNTERYSLFWGYSNTQKMLRTFSQYPAARHASDYFEDTYPAPDNSSGWFLPSSGQCWYWYQNRGILKPFITKVGGHDWDSKSYWSSSEVMEVAQLAVWILNFSRGVMEDRSKTAGSYVRSCLAF